MTKLPFVDGNDRIANILLVPLVAMLGLVTVQVVINMFSYGFASILGLLAIPLIPFIMMPAQTILFIVGRDQEIHRPFRKGLALLSYLLLISLFLWVWENSDALSTGSTSAVAIVLVAFAQAGIALVVAVAAKKFSRSSSKQD